MTELSEDHAETRISSNHEGVDEELVESRSGEDCELIEDSERASSSDMYTSSAIAEYVLKSDPRVLPHEAVVVGLWRT